MASKDLPNGGGGETTNFDQLSRLIIDVCRNLLMSVLKAKLPPSGLTPFLQSEKVQLFRNLGNRHRQIFFPSPGLFLGTLEDLDFTLLYKLIRHLRINIPPHNNGWGRIPDPSDRSVSANIDRLRVQRNETVGHPQTVLISDSEFCRRWSLIRQSVLEIEKDVLNGDSYIAAVDGLLNEEKRYIQAQELLMNTLEADPEVKVPTNVNDVHEKETNYKKSMEKKTETQTIKLTFIGHARAGKTCLMRQLLRKRIKPGGPDRTNLAELLTKRLKYKLGTSAKEKEKIEKGKEAELCRQRLRGLRKRRGDTEMTLIYQRNDLLNADSNADIGHHLNDEEEYSDHSEEESSHVKHKRKTIHMTEDQRKAIEDINKEDESIDDSSVAYVTLFDFGGDEVFSCQQTVSICWYLMHHCGKTQTTKIKSLNEKDICDKISAKLQERHSGMADIFDHHVKEIFFFADMDNSDLNEEKYLDVWCELEKCVHLQSCWHDIITGTWLALEEKVMLEKEKGIKFLNIQQILDINSELLVPLEENELVPFLRYMHNAGSIICFDIFGKMDSESLTEQDKVQIKMILDINWIIKAFGAIITDDKFVDLNGNKQRIMWKKYKATAMLTDEVLELQLRNVTKEDREVLISQMKNLGLITERISKGYIVPCLLGEAESDCIKQILNNESVYFTKTLCLVFHDQFVPQAIWDKTVAFCLHEFGECTYQERGDERRPKRGFICRNVDDIWNFVLHCKGAMLKMTMFNHHEQLVTHGVGENLRLKIEGIINSVLSMANQGHRTFDYYLHCDFWIHDAESHVGKPKIETMRKCRKYRVKDARGKRRSLTEDDCNAWFGAVSKTSSSHSQQLQIKKLHADMVRRLSGIFRPNLNIWQSILVELEAIMDPADLFGDDIKHFGEICRSLMCKGTIAHGSYDELHCAVRNVDAQAAKIVKETSIKIKTLQPEGPSEAKRPNTGE